MVGRARQDPDPGPLPLASRVGRNKGNTGQRTFVSRQVDRGRPRSLVPVGQGSVGPDPDSPTAHEPVVSPVRIDHLPCRRSSSPVPGPPSVGDSDHLRTLLDPEGSEEVPFVSDWRSVRRKDRRRSLAEGQGWVPRVLEGRRRGGGTPTDRRVRSDASRKVPENSSGTHRQTSGGRVDSPRLRVVVRGKGPVTWVRVRTGPRRTQTSCIRVRRRPRRTPGRSLPSPKTPTVTRKN